MGCCTARCMLLATCILQLVATIQRQILDFLGFMWTPIVANFIQIIVIILGIFGAYQYKTKYVVFYAVWTSIWLGWNIFVICFYLEAGILTRDSDVLNMGTGSRSWWFVNGAGCIPTYANNSDEDPLYFPTPLSVDGCFIEYFYVESIQAAVQCVLAVIGIIVACFAIYAYTRDDDACAVKRMHSLPYRIEFHHNNTTSTNAVPETCSHICQRPMTDIRPMTPRKVKQRSTRSRKGSRRRYSQNPVTKLINASSAQNNCGGHIPLYTGQVNQAYTRSRPPSEDNLRTNSVLFLNSRPSPIYMNTTSDSVI